MFSYMLIASMILLAAAAVFAVACGIGSAVCDIQKKESGIVDVLYKLMIVCTAVSVLLLCSSFIFFMPDEPTVTSLV